MKEQGIREKGLVAGLLARIEAVTPNSVNATLLLKALPFLAVKFPTELDFRKAVEAKKSAVAAKAAAKAAKAASKAQ